MTTRRAILDARDREDAKRRFAAYVLYDEVAGVRSDIVIAGGEHAELTPAMGAPPIEGGAREMRAWLKRHDEETEAFDVALYEDGERAIGNYLQLLAANDPWRLEGHGSYGRVLSGVAVYATLRTFDRRIEYRFDATQYFDYVRLDVLAALDPHRLRESVRVDALVDVSALRDRALQQIASSYEGIANEMRLTARFTDAPAPERPYDVALDAGDWAAYLQHRRDEPERFAPPAGWARS